MPTVIEQQDRAVTEAFNYENVVQISDAAINEAALLIEKMELTEPMKVAHAPNHLLETKTYAKVGHNDFVHTKPSIIHFEGFEINKKQVKSLKLLNASSDVLRIHIIPPQTQNFTIQYSKPTKMVPGMALDCMIEFKPDEWRYYYDCVRIHCPGEDNLIIPIHAYPIMNTKQFPRSYTFKPIPIGSRIYKTFPLKSMSPIDFEFNFKYIKAHTSFSLEPMSGIVPANSQTEVTVTFTPYEFHTASMLVELTISQFNLKPIVTTFTGSSLPGLLKEKTLLITESEILDPKCVSPLGRARTKKQKAEADRNGKQRKKSSPGLTQMTTLEKDGIHFPAALDTPQAVAKVLMQEPGKLLASEMRQSMLTGNIAVEQSNKQLKEAIFEQAVRQNVHEERQNQLRWQVKVGDNPLSAQDRYKILEDRNILMTLYKLTKREDPVAEEEICRLNTTSIYCRTMRNVNELAPEDAMFDVYSNDLWAVRYVALERFVQAARKVIFRARGDKRLRCLKNLVKDFNQKKSLGLSEGDNKDSHVKAESVDDLSTFTVDKIKKYNFPASVDPNVKDDMAPDVLGIVSVTPTQVVIKRDVPFFNLKVPQYYKLQGYKKYSTFIGYMPGKHTSGLRTGAEDEVIRIPDKVLPQRLVPERAADPSAVTKMVVSEPTRKELTNVSEKPQSLTIPSALFKPIEYPSLQIMNPAPGLQMFLPAVPYSEVDIDHHLCPLPRYPRFDQAMNKYPATQRKFLDREDTIKGVMSWKKFPSQGLISLVNSPTLTNAWVPRWDVCFSRDLLPEEVPPLLDRLDPDDDENCVENNEEESSICLEPAMVNSQFSLIALSASPNQKQAGDIFSHGNKIPRTHLHVGENGPIRKEKREEELEYFTNKNYNRLGTKFNEKNAELNAKITNQDLILK